MSNTNSDNSGGRSRRKPAEPRQARGRQDMIGSRLRMMYDKVVNENVPDEFLSFLEQADGRKTGSETPAVSGPEMTSDESLPSRGEKDKRSGE